jgi:hypothetical protein
LLLSNFLGERPADLAAGRTVRGAFDAVTDAVTLPKFVVE